LRGPYQREHEVCEYATKSERFFECVSGLDRCFVEYEDGDKGWAHWTISGWEEYECDDEPIIAAAASKSSGPSGQLRVSGKSAEFEELLCARFKAAWLAQFEDLEKEIDDASAVEKPASNSSVVAPPLAIGEVIWGRLDETWWPGENFAESEAPEAVLASRKPDALLIKFFDGKFAWCSSEDVCGFELAYDQHCRQPQRTSPVFKDSLRVAFGRLPSFHPDGTSARPTPAIHPPCPTSLQRTRQARPV
jgi:hypothetical protein